MARHCEFCGKDAMNGNKVSHSNVHTKRMFEPNLQRVHALIGGAVRHVNACTRCIRSGRVVRAPKRKPQAAAPQSA